MIMFDRVDLLDGNILAGGRAIRKDASWLQLFGQFYGLVTPGQNGVMGDFNKLRI